MAFSHTVGGTTFTEASFEGNAYADESTGFPKALEKMVEHVANAYRGTSTTSNAVGTGSKTWTVTNSNSQIPAFAVGMPVRVARTSAPTTTYMQGEVTAFTAATGSTTVNVSSSLGSGTHTDWTITIGGHQTTAAASPLGVADGGTGAASYTAGDIIYADGTTSMAKLAKGDASQFLAMNGGATAPEWVASPSTDLTAIADGSVGSPSLANSGDDDTGIYFPAANTVGVVAGGTEQFRFGSNPIPGGSKNLVQNGNFTVAQRGTVTSPADGDYLTDRWKNWQTTGGVVTVTQDASGVFAAFGTDTAMKIDVTTAESSVAAGDYFVVTHPIEAQNLQHLKYGLAGAEAITVSFCFQSPKSGTHYVAIYQADAARYIWRPFTVTSADTAEYFSLTFAGDTSGTINNDTGIGFNLYFPLMAGTDFEGGSDNTWASGAKYGAATMQNLLDNTANNIYIGLVQMEVGSVATDFEFEDIGTTLAKAQRYFNRAASGDQVGLPPLAQTSTTAGYPTFQFPVQMRAKPSLSYSDLTHFGVNPGGAQQNPAGMPISYGNNAMAWLEISWGSGAGSANDACRFYTISASATLDFIAEL